MQNNDPEEKIQKIREAIAALGIAETNSYDNFKRKYKKASLEFHPDKQNRTDQRIVDEATEIFKNIGAAHTELKNRKDNWNAVIRAGRLDNGSWPASKMENYEKRLRPSTPRSQNRPARNFSNNNNNNTRSSGNTSYAMSGNNIIQNGNMRPPTRPSAATNNNARPNSSYTMSGNNIIQNGNMRPPAAAANNNARANTFPPKRNNTSYATRRIIQNDLLAPKKPSFFSRLFARFFGGAPKIDPRMFGRPIADMFWEHAIDETRMIKIVPTKKAAMKEIQFFSRANPSIVAKVYDLYRYGDAHAIVMDRVDVQRRSPATCEDAARISKIVESLHSTGIAHYCLDGYHLGRSSKRGGEFVVVGFEHAVMFDTPVTPEMHDRVMRRDRKPLSDYKVPILLSSFSC
jgi:hypothetical protein